MPATKTVFQKALYISLLAVFGIFIVFSATSLKAETVSSDTPLVVTPGSVISGDSQGAQGIESPVDNSTHRDSDKDDCGEESRGDDCGGHLSVTLTANPQTIHLGDSSTLTWDSKNTKYCSANWTTSVATSGTQTVNPTETHTYEIFCTGNPGDKVSASVTVTVSKDGDDDEHSSVTLTAVPQIIHLGETSLLTWDSKNTKYCSANWTTSVATSGTQTVSPTETKIYEVSCANNSGDRVHALVTVTVIKDGGQCPLPTFVSPLVASGKVGVAFSYTLTATSTGSTTAITYKVGTSTLPAGLTFTPNTISGTPTASGVFNIPLKATNQCGVDEKTLVLTVAPADNGGGDHNPTATLTANPSTIPVGATSTLSWVSTNTTSCYAPWTSATSTSGSFVVSPATTTAYTLICSNATKSATSTTTVTVTTDNGGGGNSPTVTLSALPTSILSGATSTLSWVSTNTTSCSAPWTTATTTSGSFVVSPATTTAYSIACSNGTQSATSTATVTVTTDNGGGGNSPAVTLSANPSTITAGQGSTLSWTSTNTTSCSASWTTATSTSGSELVSPTATTGYTIVCSNPTQSATSTVTVTVSTTNGGGGGGGGGGSSGGGGGRSGSRHYVGGGAPAILGAATSCTYLEDYLHIGQKNNPVEVIKLQVFLNALEGFKNLKISGTFDQDTFDAVSSFQNRYKADILTPWGYKESTGYVYILTKKKVNEIYCEKAFPLNPQQEQEISDFRALIQGLSDRGIDIPGMTVGATSQGQGQGQISSTNTSLPVNFTGALANTIKATNGKVVTAKAPANTVKANNVSNGILRSGIFSNPQWRSVAAAIFAGPLDSKQSFRAVLIFLILLIAIYLLSGYVVGRQNKDGKLSVDSLRLRKVFFFVLGLLVAVLGSLALHYYALVLPLLVLVVILSVVALWLSLKKKEVRTLVEIKD